MLRRVALVRTDVSEERRLLQEQHGVTTQKTPFFDFKGDLVTYFWVLVPYHPGYLEENIVGHYDSLLPAEIGIG
jgi:hypothetical protein